MFVFFPWLFSSIKKDYTHRHLSLCLFITIACLLLGLTNAHNINNTTNNDTGIVAKVSHYAGDLLADLKERLHDNSTSNESSNSNQTSIFHKPQNMTDVRNIFLFILQILAQALMIVSYYSYGGRVFFSYSFVYSPLVKVRKIIFNV